MSNANERIDWNDLLFPSFFNSYMQGCRLVLLEKAGIEFPASTVLQFTDRFVLTAMEDCREFLQKAGKHATRDGGYRGYGYDDDSHAGSAGGRDFFDVRTGKYHDSTWNYVYWTDQAKAVLLPLAESFPKLDIQVRRYYLGASDRKPDGAPDYMHIGQDINSEPFELPVEFRPEARLIHKSYKHWNLQNSDLRGSELKSCTFSHSEMEQSNFSQAELTDPVCFKTNLQGANFSNAKVNPDVHHKGVFQEANLEGADFSKALLRSTDFRKANLKDATFAGATLWKVDLRGADLTGCVLTGVDLSEVKVFKKDIANAIV